MPSITDHHLSVSIAAAGPVAALPTRTLRIDFPAPSGLLRALGRDEQASDGLWSGWLAQSGWTWSIQPDALSPVDPLVSLWLDGGRWPERFDPRVLLLAAALELHVDGIALSLDGKGPLRELPRVWRAIEAVTQETLEELLAVAALQANSRVFDFNSVAPSWPAEVSRVLAERRNMADERAPSQRVLAQGYRVLGEDGFTLLRSEATTLDDCALIWESLGTGQALPLALELAFWWEATYCLTERHAYEDAEQAGANVDRLAARLATITGLVEPMWHHQRGRLHYYAGDHGSALKEFAREYQGHANDLRRSAMLEREIANVLTDLACPEAAHHFAKRSVETGREQGQRSELYKSLGRLAEIHLRLGEPDKAVELLGESLRIQESLRMQGRMTAQTLCYLGHANLLNSNIQSAESYYERVAGLDDGGASRPYLLMGRFALAAATHNPIELEHLWNAHSDQLAAWEAHVTHVLPAVVCTLIAADTIDAARSSRLRAVRALIARRYAVEAAFATTMLSEDEREPLLKDIAGMLGDWSRALKSLPPGFVQQIGAPLNGPSRLADLLRRDALREDDSIRGLSYPLSLIP